MKNIHLIGRFFGIVLFTALIAYVLINNLSPFGIKTEYSLENSENIISVGPKDRIKMENQDGQKIIVQTHNLIYFSTPMPFNFDTATVRVLFQNPDPEQAFSLGFQDQETWHYSTQLLDVPFLNSLEWTRIGTNPVLYQKIPKYTSVNNFLLNPPTNALIGIYDYDTDLGKVADAKLQDYSPSKEETIITSPLRGKITLYAYLQNEPFTMTIQKQDLNWYEDPDPITVNIYKDGTLVYNVTLADDGIKDGSKRALPPQEVTIKNPGPGLPEPGIYKVVIDANNDTVITQIKTNLHKLVFASPIFLVGNSQVYPGIIASTSATTIYTNALTLSAITLHSGGLQQINVGNDTLTLDSLNRSKVIAPSDAISKVVVPKNDVTLNGYFGYFAFDQNQFFDPIRTKVTPLITKEDTNLVDYILSNYIPSTKIGDWKTAQKTFNLSSAVVKNGKLSWLLSAPDLQDNNRQVIIKNIEVILSKKGWF